MISTILAPRFRLSGLRLRCLGLKILAQTHRRPEGQVQSDPRTQYPRLPSQFHRRSSLGIPNLWPFRSRSHLGALTYTPRRGSPGTATIFVLNSRYVQLVFNLTTVTWTRVLRQRISVLGGVASRLNKVQVQPTSPRTRRSRGLLQPYRG
ncbi:hypothetical protein C8R46DRAFT_1031286 [Mycena filopes]|nr:hypothetical protein C8R46DRAFT_1031284 [Mycena filopes]KAJ7174658.1 hypothetical protein C8R46DRAFT_1031286 [Mycena filopes]